MSVALVSPLKGIPTFTNVTVSGSSPVLIAAAKPGRKTLLIQNQGAVTVFLGGPNVATSGANTGFALFAGTSFADNATAGAWYAIPASSAAVLNILEVV